MLHEMPTFSEFFAKASAIVGFLALSLLILMLWFDRP